MFTCNFTEKILETLFVGNHNYASWFPLLSQFLPQFDITTKLRVAAFLAQTMVESQNYKILEENLNYSAAGLVKTFPKEFINISIANNYAHNPEKIANKIYANKYGNKNEESGDGWKFRGRGIIQITFQSNYQQFSKKIFNDNRAVDNPDLLLNQEVAIQSALWFWSEHNLNKLADNKDFSTITKKINGGLIDETSRLSNYNKCLLIL